MSIAKDPQRPDEVKFRLLISVVPKGGRYFECGASTLGTRMTDILNTCGIDVAVFQAHILRSASIAATREFTNEQLSSVLARASVSDKVFASFYDLPI